MSLERMRNDGAFVVVIAGATPKRRHGLAWKSVRGRRAGQSSNGVFREAGRASCLLGKVPEKDHPGSTRSRIGSELSAPGRQERESKPRYRAPSLMRRRERRAEAVLASP